MFYELFIFSNSNWYNSCKDQKNCLFLSNLHFVGTKIQFLTERFDNQRELVFIIERLKNIVDTDQRDPGSSR